MSFRHRSGCVSLVLAVVAAATAYVVLSGAQAEDRMQLGFAGFPGEFQTEVGDRVFFSEGSAELGSRARTALDAQAAWLARNAYLMVTVEGHADEAGTPRLNRQLSERRAEAVRRRLIERGVAANRIRVAVYGRDRLVAECGDSHCAAQNRRAVTVIGWSDAPDRAEPAGSELGPRRMLRGLY
jgi:peptidoglycan-associated lipoprotein